MAAATTTLFPPPSASPSTVRVVIQNNTEKNINLSHNIDAIEVGDTSEFIEAHRTLELRLPASGNWSGCFAYLVDGPFWITSWRVQQNVDNQVATRIVRSPQSITKWDVDSFPFTYTTSNSKEHINDKYRAIAVIDRTGDMPTVTAIIGKPPQLCFA